MRMEVRKTFNDYETPIYSKKGNNSELKIYEAVVTWQGDIEPSTLKNAIEEELRYGVDIDLILSVYNPFNAQTNVIEVNQNDDTKEYRRLMKLKSDAPQNAIFRRIEDVTILDYKEFGIERQFKVEFDYSDFITPNDKNFLRVQKPNRKRFEICVIDGLDVYQSNKKDWTGLKTGEIKTSTKVQRDGNGGLDTSKEYIGERYDYFWNS